MLLAQNADRCGYARVRVRWHTRVGVVTTAHVWQQAACTGIEQATHMAWYLGRLVVVADIVQHWRNSPAKGPASSTQCHSHVRTLSCDVPTVWRRPQVLGDLQSHAT
jgi:predicted Zn-dependent protease